MRSALVAFISGVVFAVGLGIGGMTQPAKVIGFLDFVGNWDPSLALVMLGAVGVHSLFYRLLGNRPSSRLAPAIPLPTRKEIDFRLIGGSALFGLGWGIAGLCPGPAITSLASGNFPVVIFSVGMIAGIVVFDLKEIISLRRKRAADFSHGIAQDM
jgi:uncharacterized membrane protein YedE/YeeE